jgi:hypothetical protein
VKSLVIVASVVVAGGCLKAFAPELGPPPACDAADCSSLPTSLCSNADSDPLLSISFATDVVGGVFRRGKCAGCHTNNNKGVQQSGFDISSYAKLRSGGGRSQTSIVIDFMPCTSILVQKIGNAPPFGRRMPYDGPPYLSSGDIQLVWDWIAEGARDN